MIFLLKALGVQWVINIKFRPNGPILSSITSGNMPLKAGLTTPGVSYFGHTVSQYLAIQPYRIYPHGLMASGHTASRHLTTRPYSIKPHGFTLSDHIVL